MKLENKQELLEDEIMKYRVLANEEIITEEEFSVKEEELLFFLKEILKTNI
ncbi:hypothetical protein [Clostridium psychrophilum]|uniref:hypothetical protein n=1 Tax=Clostridium psychrophilum TaxID=132926 RepID=UPI001C0E375D|nr:hypothetical protein [Clostridium psychrophilum]MBU3182187.1 hypothetical protein [Clostridium psychrophilum]